MKIASIVRNEAGQVYVDWHGKSVMDFIGQSLYSKSDDGDIALWQRRDRISDTEWSTWREVSAGEVEELDGKYDYMQFRPLYTQSPRIEDRAAGDVEGQREAFERWARDAHNHSIILTQHDGYYIQRDAKFAWAVWRAALASATPSAEQDITELVCIPGSVCPTCKQALHVTPSAAVGEGVPVAKVISRLPKQTPEVSWFDAYPPVGALLYTIPTKPGHMVVPIEPTEAIEQAAADYLDSPVKAYGLWKAMLNATQGGKGEGDV